MISGIMYTYQRTWSLKGQLMKPKGFLILKAIIAMMDGLVLVLIPASFMDMISVSLSPAGLFCGRLLGACLTGIGFICWHFRNGTQKELRGLLLGLFITDFFGFVITLKAQVDGMMNSYGWILVAVWFLLALGLGYFRFLRRK